MKFIKSIKGYFLRKRREKVIFQLLNSRIVSGDTESSTAIRMACDIQRFIDTGEYKPDALPNGYRSETQQAR